MRSANIAAKITENEMDNISPYLRERTETCEETSLDTEYQKTDKLSV